MDAADAKRFQSRKHWTNLEDLEQFSPHEKKIMDEIGQFVIESMTKRRKRKCRDRAGADELPDGVNLEEYAIGILMKHPELSVNDIAQKIGRARGTLYRWRDFMNVHKKYRDILRLALKSRTPKGCKGNTKNGRFFEAWDGEDDDEDDEQED